MRHFLLATAVATHPLRVRQAAAPAALIALSGLAQAGAARCLRAAAIAVDLTAVAAAANNDLRPAMGAHKEAARGRHRQSPVMPKRPRRDGRAVPYGPGTRALGTSGARHRDELGGLDRCRACFFSAVKPIFLPHPYCDVTTLRNARHRARLHSPYGLAPTRPVATFNIESEDLGTVLQCGSCSASSSCAAV